MIRVLTECSYHNGCPIINTHDKFEEAHYFLHMMMTCYHTHEPFRFNLNAFIQCLRNITFALQSERAKIPNFEEWYTTRQETMGQNELLNKFVQGRNIVVKQGNLTVKSKGLYGVFRWDRDKLCLDSEVDPFADSKELLEKAKLCGLIDEGHSAIGEQYGGIKRTWIVDELGDTEVADLCFD